MNEESEFEAFDEQPFSFETEEEAEIPRRRPMPIRRYTQGRPPVAIRKSVFRRPLIRRNIVAGFPPRFPFQSPVRPAVWPGLFTPSWPVRPPTYPVGPSDQPPPSYDGPFGAAGSGNVSAPIGDEPDSRTFDSDAIKDPSAFTGAPGGVDGAPVGVERGDTNEPSGPSTAADDSSEFYLEFESEAPSSSTTFIPTAVENPGGGRIKNKRPPERSELVNVRGVGRGQVPLHRLAATALEALVNAARAVGLAEPLLRPVSGFRDPARQAQLWQRALVKYGSAEEARKWVAPPGSSAHQSGRAIDFYLGGHNASNRVARLRTLPAYGWLVGNARRFGFYPYEREPWHWEYNPPSPGNRVQTDQMRAGSTRNRVQTDQMRNGPKPNRVVSHPIRTVVRDHRTPQGSLGTLTSNAFGRRFSYRFTPKDLVWTTRFLVGEAGGRDDLGNRAVIWAMLNRYALFTNRVYPTFHEFIRAYSTTLQPILKSAGAARRHMNSATFVRTGGNYPGTNVPRGQTQRHLRLQKSEWDQLPAGARSLAEKALKGQVTNPIGNATEFGSTYVYFHDRYHRYPNAEEWQRFTQEYARQKNWIWIGQVPGLNQRGNAFFIQQRAAKLPRNSVRVSRQRESEIETEEYERRSAMGVSPRVFGQSRAQRRLDRRRFVPPSVGNDCCCRDGL